MKRCPTCQRTYPDDTLRFCLEDGTALTNLAENNQGETLLMDSAGLSADAPPPTEILDYGPAPTVRSYSDDATAPRRKPAATIRQQGRPTQIEYQNAAAPTLEPRARSTSSVVAITVAVTILLLGLGGLGAWLLLRNKGGDDPGASGTKTETARASSNSSSSNTTETGTNTNTLPNTNSTPISTPTPLSTPAATPQTTPQAGGSSTTTARTEVESALNGWTQTMRSANLEGHMAYYADTLHTYYMQSNVSVSRVRTNVAKAFSKYSSFDVKLTNMQIEVDPSGTSAVATFDKTFVFSGSSTYSGSGLNRFWFEKIGGRWLITGEKDLKTYYINSNQ